jgi:hypothetical protein
MNIGNIALGALFIALCILPFYLSSRSARKRQNRLLKALQDFAAGKGGTISRHEVCGDIAIGIDDQKKRAYFVRKVENNESAWEVDLGVAQSCHMDKGLGLNLNLSGSSTHAPIHKIDLVFQHPTIQPTSTLFPLYRAVDTLQLQGELQLAEKWCQIFDAEIKRK